MKKYIIAPIIILILIAGFFLWQSWHEEDESRYISQTADTSISPRLDSQKVSEVYTHPSLGFSFMYPDDFAVRTVALGEGEIAVVEQKSDSTTGFQVLVSPSPYPTLSVDVLGSILSGIEATNVRELTVAYEARGFIFNSANPSFEGGSVEAWFVHEGKLYQVSSYAKNESLILQSLFTWKFK